MAVRYVSNKGPVGDGTRITRIKDGRLSVMVDEKDERFSEIELVPDASPAPEEPTPAPEAPAEPDPEPAPPEDTATPPAPSPAPPTQPPATPIPGKPAWYAEVENLRTKRNADPRTHPHRFTAPTTELKGQQSLFGVTLKDGRLILRPGAKVDINGFYSEFTGSQKLTNVIQIDVGAELTSMRNFEFRGPFGKHAVGTAMLSKKKIPDQSGPVMLLEDGRIEGWPFDMLNIIGKKGAEQVVRRIYMGPLWGFGSAAHSDMMNLKMMLGDVLVERCLFDRVVNPDPAANITGNFNNWLRAVPNNLPGGAGKEPVIGQGVYRIKETIINCDVFPSFPFHVGHTATFKPVFEFEDVYLCAEKFSYRGNTAHIRKWVNVRDYKTGALIPSPV